MSGESNYIANIRKKFKTKSWLKKCPEAQAEFLSEIVPEFHEMKSKNAVQVAPSSSREDVSNTNSKGELCDVMIYALLRKCFSCFMKMVCLKLLMKEYYY